MSTIAGLFYVEVTFSSANNRLTIIAVTLPPSPPHTFIILLTIRFLAGRWSTSGSEGVMHISWHYKNTIEGAGENRRTNEQTLGVNSRAKRWVMQHYISDSIYGLTLAWITSENSTKLLECRLLDSIFFAGPYLLCYCVWSRPHLSVPVANCLSAPFSNQLSSRVPLPLPATLRF